MTQRGRVGGDADRLVGRHKGDQECRDPHAQQGGDQCRLAADAVAVMAEDRCADRAADKADEVGAERRQGSGQRIFIGEVELPEDQSGRGAVDEEIVPLDRRADRRGDDRLAQLRTVVGGGQPLVGGDAGHAISSSRYLCASVTDCAVALPRTTQPASAIPERLPRAAVSRNPKARCPNRSLKM
jgi:hypothetical protein